MMPRWRLLSGNVLKIIAALAMTVDHVGVIIYPQYPILRVIGRLAFPIFAYMIAEGCRYTRNRIRYFLSVFLLGVVCQTAVYVYMRETQLNILLTFALSVLLIFFMQRLKAELYADAPSQLRLWGSYAMLVLGVAGVIALGFFADLDYGAAGCMVPLMAAIPHPIKRQTHTTTKRHLLCVLTTSLGLLALAIGEGGAQYFSLFSIPLLLLYSGKRGKWRMKYFFYIFYPLHLLAIWGVWMLLF